MEQCLLQTAPCVETGREVVGSERAAQRRAGALKHDSDYQKYREDYLHVRQSRLEKNHPLENSTGVAENQRFDTVSQYYAVVKLTLGVLFTYIAPTTPNGF